MTEKCFFDHTGFTIDAFRDLLQLRLICVKEFIEERHHDTCPDCYSIGKVQEISSEDVDESDRLQDTGSVSTESNGSEKVTHDSISSDQPDVTQSSDT